MKQYLHCISRPKRGDDMRHNLKLSEAHLIAKIALECDKVLVSAQTCTKAEYKLMFG